MAIGDVADGERLIAHALEVLGTVDAIVSPAIVLRDRMVYNLSQLDWDLVLKVNLTGVFGLVRAAIPHMRAAGHGHIVTFTSGAGIEGRAGTSNYAAAKMGVVGFTKSVAKEVERHGIRVNCIAPRARTRASQFVAADRSPIAEPLHFAALGDPKDVAQLVLYLASEECSVTGRVFACSGSYLGVYPDFVPVALSDSGEPLTHERVAELVGAMDIEPAVKGW
jgi:NAD(P)-dependent dehydrogenase (short-subunit alcohol dehydrogenase family)